MIGGESLGRNHGYHNPSFELKGETYKETSDEPEIGRAGPIGRGSNGNPYGKRIAAS
jgi:hypothetical protein